VVVHVKNKGSSGENDTIMHLHDGSKSGLAVDMGCISPAWTEPGLPHLS